MADRGTKIIAGVIIAAFAAVAVVVAGPGIDSLSFLDGDSSSVTCGWQTLNVNGTTYSSIDELSQAAEEHGTSLEKMREQAEFRVRDGVVQFRPTNIDCGAQHGGAGD